jgi:NDP-sugar pyrophosphorylase family protein
MKAMILAAGRGTRLRPYTDTMPKALIKVNGTPVLEILIRKLTASGFDKLIINIHHFGEQIVDFLGSRRFPGVDISISDERDLLLDTGGAIRKAASLIGDDEPCLIHNVDVISDLDLGVLMSHHRQKNNMVTLCVRQRPSSRYFHFNEENRLTGWENTKTSEEKLVNQGKPGIRKLAFSGIHVIGPGFFHRVQSGGCFPDVTRVFSIVDVYLCLAANARVSAFDHSGGLWIDIGTSRNLEAAFGMLGQIKQH